MINILPVRPIHNNHNIAFGRKNKPNLNSKKHDIYSRRTNQNSRVLDFYGYNDIVITKNRIQSMDEVEKKEEIYSKLSKALARYDFNAIISSLINKNQFSDSNIYLEINDNKDSYAKLSIVLPENTDDDKIDNFTFSVNEFKELILTLKKHVSNLYPEHTKEYEENTYILLNQLNNIQ